MRFRLKNAGSLVISAVLLFTLVTPYVFASTARRPTIVNKVAVRIPDEVQDSIDRLKLYITISEEWYIIFDEVAAADAGEDSSLIEMGVRVSQMSMAYIDDQSSFREQATRDWFPIYGKLCRAIPKLMLMV